MVTYVVAIVLIAFIFDFSNGFHDSANSIATIVGTRVLSPLPAVIWAAFFNFVAVFTVGTAVAKAIGSGMIDRRIVNPNVILAALLGAIIWNIDHVVLRHPVELVARAHRRLRGRGGREGAGWAAIVLGDEVDPDAARSS